MIYWYEQDKNTAVIKFYANIEWWYNNATSFTALFEALDAKYANIIIRVHCYGGNVFEGNAIYNCIGGAQATVTWRIEGVCMSMGTIIMLSADRIEMCENSIVMIHEPSGGAYGNQKDMLAAAKLLGIMNKNATAAYAKKMGKKQSDFAAEYFDGYDHFLSAEECKELGLISEIIPAIVKDVKEVPIPEPDDEGAADVFAIWNSYAALGEMKDEGEQEYCEGMKITKRRKAAPTSQGIKTPHIMNKKELIAQYGLTGVDENTPDKEFMAALETAIKAKASNPGAAPGAQAQSAATANDAVANKASAEQLLAGIESVTGKEFEPTQRASLISIGEAGGVAAMQAAMKLMAPAAAAPAGGKVPEVKQFMKPGGTAPTAQDRKDWSYDKWNKEDPRGLERMEKEDVEQFNALYKAEYGELPIKA